MKDILFEDEERPPEYDAFDVVKHWAMVESDIKDAVKEAKEVVLKKHGMTKQSFKELADTVLSAIGNDEVKTEYGKVMKIPDKPIHTVRASVNDRSFERRKLYLVQAEYD